MILCITEYFNRSATNTYRSATKFTYWREMGARSVLEARGLLKKMALETLGIAAVRANARCKLDRAALALGGNEGSEARRRTDRYNYEEQRRFRRNLEGHRRNQRFNGWRANRWGG